MTAGMIFSCSRSWIYFQLNTSPQNTAILFCHLGNMKSGGDSLPRPQIDSGTEIFSGTAGVQEPVTSPSYKKKNKNTKDGTNGASGGAAPVPGRWTRCQFVRGFRGRPVTSAACVSVSQCVCVCVWVCVSECAWLCPFKTELSAIRSEPASV